MAGGITDAYLKREAGAFFPAHPWSAASRRLAVERAVRPLSPSVADELEAQNARYAPSAQRDRHLAALRRGAAAVVTGQQVGLFLGPLFTVYKAASAIRAARELSAETGAEVVPVFWLQTEDHDLPEIASCAIPSKQGVPLTLRVRAEAEQRTSVEHLRFGADVEDALQGLARELEGLPHAAAHLSRLRRHYRPGAGWTESFAGVLAELFADEGLVLVDPRTPALSAEAAPLHRRALEEAEAISAALTRRCDELQAAHFAVAVHVRPGSPLSFFHPQGVEGPRFRLEASGGGLREVGGDRTHSKASLLSALEAEPRSFSTSALLRPILQDTMLPTAAYVGGPGEIAYFSQLAPLYAHFGVTMPLIVPRARFRVVDERATERLARLGLEAKDVERPLDEVLARCASPRLAGPSAEEVRTRLLSAFEGALAELDPALRAHPAMSTPVRKTRSTVARAVGKLARHYQKAQRRSDEATAQEVRSLQDFLFPERAPQERSYALAGFAARYGERAFLERVLAAIQPFDGTPRDLKP